MALQNLQKNIKTVRIDSILDGQSSTYYFSGQNQFLASIGIDPDSPLTDASTDVNTSGVIRPVAYAKFSGVNVNSYPIAFITNPKDTKVYVVLKNGKIISYTSALGSETLVGTVAGNNAEGAGYYNNYIYVSGTGAGKNDVSRYGPLDGTPALTDAVWTGTTLGSQTALGTPTMATSRNSVSYPAHWMFPHVDGSLYLCDFVNGQGSIHKIITKKVTAQGDTNNGTTANKFNTGFPFDYIPTCVSAYSTSLAIGASITTDGTAYQGNSCVLFWDTVNLQAYRWLVIPDPLITALRYQNGVLYGWSGTTKGGVRFWKYIGGDTIQTIWTQVEGHPPLPGAVTGMGARVSWGAFTTYPANSASVFAYGFKSDALPKGVQNVAQSSVTATSANGVITALGYPIQSSLALPNLILGGTDGTNFNLDQNSTIYTTHYWRSEVFNVGREFRILRIRLRLGAAIAANMTLTPTIFLDDESASAAGTTINSTNYTDSRRYVTVESFASLVSGRNNFLLELKFSGTALLPVLLPVEIDVELTTNANQ